MYKLITLLTLCMSTLFAGATDYPYMIVRQANGIETTLDVVGLEFSVSGGTLTATDKNGSRTFLIADLADMYFSTDCSGLTEVFADGQPVEVYTIDGTHIGCYVSVQQALSSLGAGGVYILKNKARTVKIKLTK